jgi:flagellar protein FliJ
VPRFRFQLEPVLRQRLAVEREKQLAVGKLEQQRLMIEATIRRHQESLTASKTDLRSSLIGPVNVNDLRGTAASTMRIMSQAQKLVLELAAIHKRLQHARAELIEATKRRRAVELLRDRRFEQWKRKLNKAEDAILDELAVQRAGAEKGVGSRQ